MAKPFSKIPKMINASTEAYPTGRRNFCIAQASMDYGEHQIRYYLYKLLTVVYLIKCDRKEAQYLNRHVILAYFYFVRIIAECCLFSQVC